MAWEGESRIKFTVSTSNNNIYVREEYEMLKRKHKTGSNALVLKCDVYSV